MTDDLPLALFTSSNGKIQLQVRLQDETLWITQRQLAELFGKTPPTINEHLKNIFNEGELAPEATIRKFRMVAREGTRTVERLLDHCRIQSKSDFDLFIEQTEQFSAKK